MAKFVNLVESYAGNAGGSLVTSLLVEYFLQQQRPYLLCDLDRVSPDVWKRYRDLGSATIDDLSLEDIIDRIDLDDREAIVNVPTIAYERMVSQVDDAISMGFLRQVQLRRWIVVTNRKSWGIFERIADAHDDAYQPILVHNLIDGFELTGDDYEFCEERGIPRVPLTWIQFNNWDLELLEMKTDRSLFSLLPELSEQSQSRLKFFSSIFFKEVDAIVRGV
jgi:hypothetical protein